VSKPLKAENLSQFLEQVSVLAKKWGSKDEPAELWYRGHQKAWWRLLPKLYRDLPADESARAQSSASQELCGSPDIMNRRSRTLRYPLSHEQNGMIPADESDDLPARWLSFLFLLARIASNARARLSVRR